MGTFKEELIVIRHARSAHNVRDEEGLNAGITDWGQRQSENVANFLKAQFDLSGFCFITSPFLRCLLTALPIQNTLNGALPSDHARFGAQFEVWPEMAEYLNHSGKECWVERNDEFPFDWSRFPESKMLYEEYNEIFLNRVHDGFTLLPEKSLVVTHGLPSLTLIEIAKGNYHMPVWDYSVANCSITYIKRGRVVWHGRNLYHERDYDNKMYVRDYTVGNTINVEGK